MIIWPLFVWYIVHDYFSTVRRLKKRWGSGWRSHFPRGYPPFRGGSG